MINKIISYTGGDRISYRGDAPTPRSMELIQKNLDAIMKTQEDYWKWKEQQMKKDFIQEMKKEFLKYKQKEGLAA